MSRKAKSLFISEFEDNKIFGSIEKLILNLKIKANNQLSINNLYFITTVELITKFLLYG